MKTLLILLLIPIVRCVVNFYYWNYLRRVLRKHKDWIDGLGDSVSVEAKKMSGNAAMWIETQTSEINRVYELTGRGKPLRSFMDAVGYGHVQPKHINLLDNLLVQSSDTLKEARQILTVGKGHFWTAAVSSLNPIFWLGFVFFLPRSIVTASGIKITNKIAEIIVQIVQLLYWGAIVIAMVLYPEALISLINNKPS